MNRIKQLALCGAVMTIGVSGFAYAQTATPPAPPRHDPAGTTPRLAVGATRPGGERGLWREEEDAGRETNEWGRS